MSFLYSIIIVILDYFVIKIFVSIAQCTIAHPVTILAVVYELIIVFLH